MADTNNSMILSASIAGEKHDIHTRSRIEEILQNQGGSTSSGGSSSGGSTNSYSSITLDELAEMWGS